MPDEKRTFFRDRFERDDESSWARAFHTNDGGPEALLCQVCGEMAESVRHRAAPPLLGRSGYDGENPTVGVWMHHGGRRCTGIERRQELQIIAETDEGE